MKSIKMTLMLLMFFAIGTSCSIGQFRKSITTKEGKEVAVGKYWQQLVDAMERGDTNAVKSMMTERTFKSFVRSATANEYSKVLRLYATSYKKEPIKISLNSDTQAQIDLGEDNPDKGYYTSGFVLKFLDNRWLMTEYYPAK